MEYPRVLVGCPVSDYHNYCTEEYLNALNSLTYKNKSILLVDNSRNNDFFNYLAKKRIDVVKIPFHENPRVRIINARNVLRQKVIDAKYDYFLSLEQDVIPPKDIIERAIFYEKDILTGVYCGNIKVGSKMMILPLVYKFPRESRLKEASELINSSRKLKELKNESGLSTLDMVKEYYGIGELEQERLPTKVHSCGLGCVLIHRKVLEKIQFRFSEKYGGWDDVWFCDDAKKAGFEIYVDPKIKCMHLIKNRHWKWDNLLNNVQ